MENIDVLGDNYLVKLEVNKYGYKAPKVDTLDKGIVTGIVVGICKREDFNYFGFNSYAFDKSLVNKEVLDELYACYSKHLSKRIWWRERSEMGNVIEVEGEPYAAIKFSDVIFSKEEKERSDVKY